MELGLESIWGYLTFSRFSSTDSILWHIAMESNTKFEKKRKQNRIFLLGIFCASYTYKRRKKTKNLLWRFSKSKKSEGICFIITTVFWGVSHEFDFSFPSEKLEKILFLSFKNPSAQLLHLQNLYLNSCFCFYLMWKYRWDHDAVQLIIIIFVLLFHDWIYV